MHVLVQTRAIALVALLAITSGLAGACVTDDAASCVPGETRSCACEAGRTGTQTCEASGDSYGSCACGSPNSITTRAGMAAGAAATTTGAAGHNAVLDSVDGTWEGSSGKLGLRFVLTAEGGHLSGETYLATNGPYTYQGELTGAYSEDGEAHWSTGVAGTGRLDVRGTFHGSSFQGSAALVDLTDNRELASNSVRMTRVR